MKMPKTILGVATAMLCLAASTFAAKVGEKAPDFTLTDIDGNSHSLSDFAGKVVVLEWTNYGCPYVQKHYDSGNMQKLQEIATGKDVVWLSICSSAPGTQGAMSPAKWRETVKEKGVKASDVLLDTEGKVGRLYGAVATPNMYVINSEGILVYQGAIDSIPSAKQSDIAKATNYVMAALDSVFAGKPVATPTSKPYGCGVKYAK